MTAKEKAENLIDSFRTILMHEDTDCGDEILCTSISIENAKKIANEVIKERYDFREKATKYNNNNRIKFWKNVIIELKNM